ncbi:MAG: inositol-3-phosphate synthase [Acidobacteriia bacterium]|mgnify:CR=1 FL=1|nr:inositol-3-phosphate synthase [Terriglobia bacterium]
MVKRKTRITRPKGKLGILIPGLGAVATTFIAGIEAIRTQKKALPIGSLTQMGTIRLGKRTEKRMPLIKDFVPLASLDDLVFGGWDIQNESCYETARKSGVLEPEDLKRLRPRLEKIYPWKAVFSEEYVKRLKGNHVKKAKTKRQLALELIKDIKEFKKKNKLNRLVMIWCGSTEVFLKPSEVHSTLTNFEKGLEKNDPNISSSMIYAYAALSMGIPFANGAPNLSVDIPAMLELAKKNKVPICGKDFKTGQTLMKTIIAPGLKSRLIGLKGWFSTNLLGNRDGEVLDEPSSLKTKEESKLSVLDGILQPNLYPDLYRNYHHKVTINYYPPAGDKKEGWDNIDIVGWLGYPMQIKIDFLCRDSILAAPLCLDLVLFLDLAKRAGMHGIQEWLSFYFKSPQCSPSVYPEHDIFIQLMKLKNTLRHLKGEKLITHLGLEYYD